MMKEGIMYKGESQYLPEETYCARLYLNDFIFVQRLEEIYINIYEAKWSTVKRILS
jgi:hypothetical protein